MSSILIIDDDIEFCQTMESLVSRMELDCLSAHTLEQGIDILGRTDIDLVLLDVRLPDGNGLEALARVRDTRTPAPEIIIVTGLGDPDGAELAIQGGAWDYIVKPSPVKQTRLSLSRALKYRSEKQRHTAPQPVDLSQIIGNSPAMQNCFSLLASAAVSNAPVLINGETGTGKELFAQTIHNNSPRSQGEFVVVDCASLTETLLESTLFGHKKGSFSGAESHRTGLVTLADKGTLFLDEVGDMPLSTQKAFLRVLQEKRYRPLGHTREISSDFRLIAATHRDLDQLVAQGKFRQDLLFRLCSVRLSIPPLRQRKEDLKALARFQVTRLCREYKIPDKNFETGFFKALETHGWPGNIRELFNVLESAVVVSGEEKTLYTMHLPQEIRVIVARAALNPSEDRGQSEKMNKWKTPEAGPPQAPTGPPVPSGSKAPQPHGESPHPASGLATDPLEDLPTLKAFKREMEILYLTQILRRNRGDLPALLKATGLSRSHFYGLLKKHGLSL
ncbi:MAG: sigma-54 dependent transcriptional regulator [Desulfobacterales bacterium]|nr:sigma-54 dependent transcriptional regulator [Desulfobacterales bacterium]